jgi:hypothetical protein
MDYKMKHVLLIDCFGSHNNIAHVCFSKGLIPIHLFSSKKIFQQWFHRVIASNFSKCFIYETPEEFLENIKDYKSTIQFVFGCTEESQRVKDIVDELLGLNNKHDEKFKNVRYNKFELYKLLGQPASDSNFEEFKHQHGNCIIKPAAIEQSGGCLDVEFIDRCSDTLAEKSNLFISTFFEGDEYAVDLVSCDGKHKLVSVWRYVRQADEKIWKDRVELVRYEEDPKLINQIYCTASSWLNKINHRYGPTHIELKHNCGEFFCIEINFRLNGHMSHQALIKALENNQINLSVDCYTDSSKFDGDLIYYKTKGYIFRIYFLNDRIRKYDEIPWKKIETSPSVILIYKNLWPWEEVKISKKTYMSSTAIIIMYGEDKVILEQHEKEVRKLFV